MKALKNICKTLAAMLIFVVVIFLAYAASAETTVADPNVTNTVLMVDQNGKLNVSGVASVTDVATNAVNVRIAETAAKAAKNTATEVTNNLNGIVQNIMSNNVIIYRQGFTDAFEGLVVFDTNTVLSICAYTNAGISAGILSCNLGYVCQEDIGAVKPIVMHNDTLAGGRTNFVQATDEQVSDPTIHNEPRVVGTETYDKWYSVDVDIPVVGDKTKYFYFIQVNSDTPSGDGATLTLENGVTDGKSTTVEWGDKRLTFKGGVLTNVQDANP